MDSKEILMDISNFNKCEWSRVAEELCYPGIKVKFFQNPGLMAALLNTGTKKLVESSFNDLWGTGIPISRPHALDETKWKSSRILGKILMSVRAEKHDIISGNEDMDDNVSSVSTNLLDSSAFCEADDACDYLDVDARKQLQHDPNSLTLIQLNVRGMIGKLTEIKHPINNSVGEADIDAVMLCETWLNQTNYPRANIPGYKLLGNIRSGKLGGGTGILIHNSLWCRQRKDLELNTDIFKHTVVELKTNTRNILLVSGYRPPNTNASKFLKEYRDTLKLWQRQKNHDLVIGLDHNMDFLKSTKHPQTQEFLEMNLDSDLKPTITRPTRVTTKTATLIDNVFLSQRLQYQYTSNILVDDLIDHLPSIIRLKNQKKCKKELIKVVTKELNREKISELNYKLSKVPWDCTLQNLDSEETFNCFHQKVQTMLDEVIPLKMKMKSYNQILRDPWLTNSLKKCLNKQKGLDSSENSNPLVTSILVCLC